MTKNKINNLVMPTDYQLVTNVDRNGEEKKMDHFVIKMWWIKSTNNKESYVFKGRQLFFIYRNQGKIFETVLEAMVFKFNEHILNCKKIEIYDNSVYGKIKKIATFNGVETIIHKHIDGEQLSIINGTQIKYLVKKNSQIA